ncbi:MAG: hypothetical protein OXK76_07265 [Gammaproteobacteria bacterium]|nr:hypothetical protein [Gammaproteobacteria bacterium]
MTQPKISVKPIACLLLSAMFLMGMSCGAGGFSIPYTDPVDDPLAHQGGGVEQGLESGTDPSG